MGHFSQITDGLQIYIFKLQITNYKHTSAERMVEINFGNQKQKHSRKQHLDINISS